MHIRNLVFIFVTMNQFFRKTLFLVLACAGAGQFASAQEMTLETVIEEARERSVAAVSAKSEFISSYWAWRSYLASRLPSLSLIGNLGGFDRSLRLLQDYNTGELVYRSNFSMENYLGLQARQNITATGGTLYLSTQLNRLDQFGDNPSVTWYSQPLNLSYVQPIFGYNDFKWQKRISPKEYEKARRTYLESLEDINITAVTLYFNLMLADRNLETARENYRNTLAMLDVSRRRLELGSITRDEYLQLELRMLNDSLSINENEVSLRKARMELNSLLGYDESYEIVPVVESGLPDIVMDYEFVLDKSGTNSSFNIDGEINLLNAEAAIEQAKADRGITMSLNAAFGLSSSGSDLPSVYRSPLDQEIVGLTFSIPIFDWGEGRGRVKKAEAAAEVVKASVSQERNDRRISLFTSVGQFNNQRQICLVSARAENIARERYSLVMDNFRNGTASVTDLNTARSESDSAVQQYITDLSNFWVYYYTLRKYTLYDFILGQDIEVSLDELTE